MQFIKIILTTFLATLLICVFLFLWDAYRLPAYTHPGKNKNVKCPPQPKFGPGGRNYRFQEVKSYKFGQKENGYWIFIPKGADLNSLPIILLVHGGSLCRLKYPEHQPHEDFIAHLVKKGNIVIYPVYLQGFINPLPTKYVSNVALATKKALLKIKEFAPNNNLSRFAIIGYSIGGAIATHLPGIKNIPLPQSLILVEPTEGFPFFNVPFASLNKLPDKAILTAIFGSDDKLVSPIRTTRKIASLGAKLKNKYFFEIQSDFYGDPPLVANHLGFLGSYANSKAFQIDTIDYEYQKIIDASLNCGFFSKDCDIIKKGSPELLTAGTWSDGTPIKPIKKIEISR